MMTSKELHPRRHVFHGHASGVAAHIRRPKDAILDVKGASTLPVIGGHHEHKVGKTQMGKWVSFQSASTSAHGDYENPKHGLATTQGMLFEDAATVTTVAARVRGLNILGRVLIADLNLYMESRTAPGMVQPSIRLKGNRIDGVKIDGAKLKITLAETLFRKHDTKEKLASAYKSLPSRHKRLFLPCEVDGEEEATEYPDGQGTAKCTIVQKISWDGKPHPTAEIYGHVVRVPNFGKIYFGEMFVDHAARRLTLVRFQLGSGDGGEVTGGDGQTNGSTWPPTSGG
jgi:hypothetical protein